ncbi:MAG: glycine cleavage system protein GcvH [Leptospirillia bacterium]
MDDTSILFYSEDHEWVRDDGDRLVVGITDYAQSALGDLVFCDMPAEGDQAVAGEQIMEVESTKTVSAVISPVSGRLVEVHDAVGSNPNWINDDPYGDGWLFAVTPTDRSELDALMDETAYLTYVEGLSN